MAGISASSPFVAFSISMLVVVNMYVTVIFAPAFVASLIVLSTHVPLGTEVLRRGIAKLTGIDMPVFEKRRFQHGAAQESDLDRRIRIVRVDQKFDQFLVGQQPIGNLEVTGLDAIDRKLLPGHR